MVEECSYTLNEAIQNYDKINTSSNKFNLQVLSWMKELQNLRDILNERTPEEAAVEAKVEKYGEESLTDDDPFRLIDFLDSLDGISRYTGTPEEEQMVVWAEQLLKARNSVQKEKRK